jgi:hypothetical protein
MGGHKAYQFAREISWADVFLLSALPPGQVRAYFMTPLGGARELRGLMEAAGTVAVLPQATLTLAEIPGSVQLRENRLL